MLGRRRSSGPRPPTSTVRSASRRTTRERNTAQAFGSKALDAAVLLIPQVGFLPDDPRVIGTVDTVQRELATDGFTGATTPTTPTTDSVARKARS